ncbi:MAG: hypothetical protein COW65_04585 [Cytophagales bacterium CG18_big_fil_WC_8_21_14_2_50_42_9]|nr:MAG: hypothetical protein COW65_04585 [Cytophagales bacterium CG18_big_fil_WC_8_21_14_2_50_42_9]
MSNIKVVSDYEELFKVKDFAEKNNSSFMRYAFACTYERMKNDLKNQYAENIEDKIKRWVNISKVQHFEDLISVSFYMQAKMLYRDGFYEAAISVSRSICEMICYEELSKQSHSFGDLELPDTHSPSFGVLKNFLLLPKKIEKKTFQKDIVNKIIDKDLKDKDSNFLKSSYELDKINGNYLLKTNCANKEKNVRRLIETLKSVDYNAFEVFTADVLDKLEYVWTHGSTYVHVKKSAQDAREDAYQIIDNIGYVLYKLYSKEVQSGVTITSIYSRFPDICTGVSYYMDFFTTAEAAERGYYNMPSDESKERIKGVCGRWLGEWGINGDTIKGILNFEENNQYITCHLITHGEEEKIPMGISFFGDYFFINQLEGDKESNNFELSFLNNNTLIGKIRNDLKYVLFTRIISD